MRKIPFALPLIGEEEVQSVSETLLSGWITTGPKSKKFEENFREFIGAKHALAVSSATAGLHLALDAIGLKPGDKVITTTNTFASTGEVVRYFGADPVFVDIEKGTWNIDTGMVRDVLEKDAAEGRRVKAVIPVHFAGQACDMDELYDLAKKYDLAIIDDAAHALPTTYKGSLVGNLKSDITVYSFYATKTITTGEGGMVVTNNDAYEKRIKMMRLHGISREIWDRYTAAKANWFYEVRDAGFKYNMTDVAAAVGIEQLKKANAFLKRRTEIAGMYNEALGDLDGFQLPVVKREQDQHSWHLYVVNLDPSRLRISRNDFINEMADKGVGLSVHFIPMHMHPYYSENYGYQRDDFPVAKKYFDTCVSLPIYPKMSDQDVVYIVDCIREIAKKYRNA